MCRSRQQNTWPWQEALQPETAGRPAGAGGQAGRCRAAAAAGPRSRGPPRAMRLPCSHPSTAAACRQTVREKSWMGGEGRLAGHAMRWRITRTDGRALHCWRWAPTASLQPPAHLRIALLLLGPALLATGRALSCGTALRLALPCRSSGRLLSFGCLAGGRDLCFVGRHQRGRLLQSKW